MQGLLLLNKPSGITSYSAVARVKKLLNIKKAGHTGTLDPMATGVLPVLIGSATKLSDYMTASDKEYVAEILLGITTDTYDITGKVINEIPVNVSESEVISVIESFKGEIYQVPPMFSAVKKDGKKMYELARKGIITEIEPRKICIKEIEILSPLKENKISFRVVCSKGTYIRSLCHDIGEKLSCGALLSKLRRTYTAGIYLNECVNLDDLNAENIGNYVVSAEKIALNLDCINLTTRQRDRFLNGGDISLDRVYFKGESGVVRVKSDGEFLGLGFADKNKNNLVIRCNLNPIPPKKRNAVALGTFDGVHKGHMGVLKAITDNNYIPNVVCFKLPPKFNNDNIVLTEEAEKTEIFKKLGIENIEMLDFGKVKDVTDIEFLKFIKQKYNPKLIACGYNYHFGKSGTGNKDTIIEFCEENGIKYKICDEIKFKKASVSSSHIRQLLKSGETEMANKLLGRNYSFCAAVEEGEKRGRKIGFPTVNQYYPEIKAAVKFGVYKTKLLIDGKEYRAVTNIGIRPTFKSDRVIAESYVFGLSEEIYGKTVKTELLSFLREEKKFSSLEELKNAIKEDIKSAEKT